MAKLSDYHGEVKKCHCTNADPRTPMDCKACFSRGFVATCKACEGNGQITIPVAGTNSGDMKSTCDKCGGTGTFPANKPEGWDEQQAAIAKAAEEAELQAV